MDRLTIIIIVLLMIACFLGGFVAGRIHRKVSEPETFGTLRVDRSDPDGPYLFLELDRSPEPLVEMETVTFKVDNRSYLDISDPQDSQSL